MHNGVVYARMITTQAPFSHSTVFQTRPSLKEKKQRGDKDRGRRRHATTPQPRVFALTTRNRKKRAKWEKGVGWGGQKNGRVGTDL